jgi:hypothetical protein
MTAPDYLSEVAVKLNFRGYAINWHKGHREMTASKLGNHTRYSFYGFLKRVSGPKIEEFP